MGKKRKASGRFKTDEPRRSPERTKLTINSYEDVADSEDEFLINRDRILLEEEPDAKRRRRAQENDTLLEASDEEVLTYPDSEDEDGADIYEEENEEYHSAEEDQEANDVEDAPRLRRNGVKNRKELDEEEDEEEGWGDSKKDYYGADAIDTEQAALDEEAEAKRLQQKQLEAMEGASMLFGMDEEESDSDAADDEDADNTVTEVLPDLQVPEDLDNEGRLKLLRSRYPELDGIAKDWLELHELQEQIAADASHVNEVLELRKALKLSDGKESHIALIRQMALGAYLGACAMYFAVLTSTANGSSSALALPPKKLREHPVIESVLGARQMWEDVRQYPRIDTAAEVAALKRKQIIENKKNAARKAQEEEAAIAAAKKEKLAKKAKKSRITSEAERAQAASEARRLERLRKVEEELADLSALASEKPRKKPSKLVSNKAGKLIINEDDSDLGDETVLTAQELAAKAARKKSLKFYTSQIAQKANKYGARGKDTGGDLDVPHRERLRDREARLNAAAERRGRQAAEPGEALGADSGDDEPQKTKKRDVSDEEDYYDMVAARSKQKKADRQAAASAYAEAARQNAQVYEVEEVEPDGKRRINYQIEKNKGLTPHRKKEIRNPRVKKKLKYAEKLKKLSSTKQVYKGGEGRGGYGGELSGIKTGLVKSVQL